jgi:ribosomal protein L37AE/L43A
MKGKKEERYGMMACPVCRIQTRAKISRNTLECMVCGTQQKFKGLAFIHR